MGAKSARHPITMKIDHFIRSRTRRRLFMLPTPSKIVSVLYYPFLWEPLTAFGLRMRDDPAARGIKTRFCYNQLSFFSHPAFCACGCKQAQIGSGGTGRHTILRGWRRKAWGFKSPLPHHLYPFAHCLLIVKVVLRALLNSNRYNIACHAVD